ncbi:DNRLRE domain-containing protein [Clostridium fungisolvens]|uniref:RHS repeat-associated core domain-containing protein n=1 Tax=Clostridium fungisolvens TaxID=1604897 RepID=A0A6V8SBS9_9CLOT|nr:DNRLRE domain-containing protein [Clostridium fungisolvens]GFP74301.1 hypothetical protein bsdtw1_00347 [Clostridium fungisolvens]
MKRNFKFIASVILIAFSFVTFSPQVIKVEAITAETKSKDDDSKKQNGNSKTKIIGELVERRSANVKQFAKDDGTVVAEVYSEPIHFYENGEWKDIDNTLSEDYNSESEEIVRNNQNSFNINFSKKASSQKMIEMKYKDYNISWSIEDALDSSKIKKADKNVNEFYGDQKGNKSMSSLTYSDVFKNVDIQYKLQSNSLKENIILKEKNNKKEFKFLIKGKDIKLKLNDDKSISFMSLKNDNEQIFKMDPLYMYDSNNEISKDVNITLNQMKEGYEICLKPNLDWINDTSRKYPIVIDPSITQTFYYGDKNNTSFKDFTVIEYGTGSGNPNLSNYLRIGYDSTQKVNYNTYIQYSLPNIPSSSIITDSKLYMYNTKAYQAGVNLNLYQVTSSWKDNSFSYTNQPTHDSNILSTMVSSANGKGMGSEFVWDITSVTKKWFNGDANNGIMLKSNGSTDPFIEFNSTEYAGTSSIAAPRVSITYIDAAGLEDNWQYETLDNGNTGKGYINKGNGELTYIHDDATILGNRLPLQIQHIYNLNNYGIDNGYGYGWRTNFDQCIIADSTYAYNCYQYIDEDGTRHYFSQDSTGSYIDDSGLNLTLGIDNSKDESRYTIVSSSGKSLTFNKDGKLKSIKDNNNNFISLTWTNNGVYRLSAVTDAVGKIYKFEYDSNNRLVSLTEPSGRKTSYTYNTSFQLQKITYSDTTYITFEYDTGITKFKNLLTRVYDINHTGLAFAYYETLSPKISNSYITSYGPNKQSFRYEYKNNTTVMTNQYTGEVDKLQFDQYGNLVNNITNDLYGSYFQYNTDGKSKNKLSYESKIQSISKNLVKNSSAEIITSGLSDSWNYINENGAVGIGSVDSNIKYMGNRSLKISKTIQNNRSYYSQTLALAKGKTYTFSGFIKTDSVSKFNLKGANLLVRYQDSSGNWVEAISNYINGSNSSWERAELTFTLPQDSISTNVNIYACISNETGNAYFDCMQLEEGNIANRYNLLENSDFDYGLNYWDQSQGITTDDGIVDIDGKKAFKFKGELKVVKNVSQNINISGDSTTPLVLGAWAKGSSLPIYDYKNFGISIVFNKTDGTKQQIGIPFNYLSNDWQYICKDVRADGTFNSISVTINYENNANIAYLDNVQLYVDEFSNRFQYDSNGNLSQSIGLDEASTKYEYNSNQDLTKITDSQTNSSKTINYDDNHNVNNEVSSEGETITYSRDNYGNVLSKKNGNDTLFVKDSSTFTSDGNYLKSETDELGNTVSYNYNQVNGLLTSNTDGKGSTEYYNYDNKDRLTSINKTVDGASITQVYKYTNDRLSNTTANGTNYNYQYDLFGNINAILVGNQKLVDISTYSETSQKTSFANGQSVNLNYDKNMNVVNKQYNDLAIARYEYDSQGLLGYKNDLVNGKYYRYTYDLSGNLAKILDSEKNETRFSNNSDGKVIYESLYNKIFTTQYTLDKDQRLKNINYLRDSLNSVLYSYDTIGRLINKSINTGESNYKTTYSFKNGLDGATSNIINSINNNGKILSYTYDNNRNIETITDNGKTIRYYYNELNELSREDNQVLNKTIVYSYDASGNILSKVEYPYTTGIVSIANKTYVYDYTDTNWKDKLTSYDGKVVTYDVIGNPLSYNGWSFSWEAGRQLKTINGNGYNISYKYNDDGIRTEKNVNGVITKYHLIDNRVTYETNGTDIIYYTYDNSNTLVSMNLNGVEYYYIKNVQGDIIGLFDKTGAQVVSYTYDSWGKLISIDGTLASSVGTKNPYRYREYRYDTETGLYYLQSRYYNADWGRFLNADDTSVLQASQSTLLGTNLFAYCGNNPTNYADPTGHWLPRVVKNILKAIVDVFCQDWIDNTLMNIVATFGGGIIGGINAFRSVKAANRLTLFIKKNPLMPTIIGVFKGMLVGFLAGEAGKISSVLGKISKYVNFEAAFDRYWIGQWLDNKILYIRNSLDYYIEYKL